jgi:hypothetical protein
MRIYLILFPLHLVSAFTSRPLSTPSMSIKSFFTAKPRSTIPCHITPEINDQSIKTSNSIDLKSSHDEDQPNKKQKIEDSFDSSVITSPTSTVSNDSDVSIMKPANVGLKLWDQLDYLEDSWKEVLRGEFNKSYFLRLSAFIDSERASKTVYPSISDTFTAFKLCPYDSVRVVIIGQDPYHGPGQAHGLAFSVQPG